MGLVNCMMHRNMQKVSEELATWAVETHRLVQSRNPGVSEAEVLGGMVDTRGQFGAGATAREKFLDTFGSSRHGLCYFLGLNKLQIRMVSRSLQFIEYMDIALAKRGIVRPPDDLRRGYLKALGLPEDAVTEGRI